jgi:hypothetical protein
LRRSRASSKRKRRKFSRRKLAQLSFKAKYEGGMFGFSEKETGTMKFDGSNQRLGLFRQR